MKPNKSKAIREALAACNGSPKLVAETLAKQGIEVSAQYVSIVKNIEKRKTQFKSQKAALPAGDLEMARQLFDVAAGLISKAGSAEAAHKVVESAALLMKQAGP